MKPRNIGPVAVNFDNGTCWPRAAGTLADIDWNLRYGEPSMSDRLVAAEVVTAWQTLLALPRKKREQVIAALRSVERASPPASAATNGR